MRADIQGALVPVPDFDTPPARDIRECSWWRPTTVGLHQPAEDGALAEFLEELLSAFESDGHHVGDDLPDILLAPIVIPDGPDPLIERVAESDKPVVLDLERYADKRPSHVVAIIRIPERVSELPHSEIVDLSRNVMARLGAPKVIFASGPPGGPIQETTFTTLEGGHPSDTEAIATRLRDRLVAAACTKEVGSGYDILEGRMPRLAWEATDTPEAIILAGNRMDELGLLPSPRHISEYVSHRLATLYARFLGLKGFSEGMLFAFDPPTGSLMLTASGSWDVDKRALHRDEVVPVGELAANGRLQVFLPEGVKPKGPSVEALEVRALLDASPKVRLSFDGDSWQVDPAGTVEAPIVRAGIHTHVGVRAVDPAHIESLPANRAEFPYGFGCGTDLMCEVVRDVVARSSAMNDPDDRRRFVRWPMLYHGDMVIELWKPGAPDRPLAGLLDLYENGLIDYTPDHIVQPL